jgi:hypothetical protein
MEPERLEHELATGPGAIALLERAAASGDLDLLRAALAGDPARFRADAASRALRKAAQYGEADAVRLLLGAPGVQPSSKGNRALEWAAARRSPEVYHLLLADPRTVLPYDGTDALVAAVEQGRAWAVRRLLEDAAAGRATLDGLGPNDGAAPGAPEETGAEFPAPKLLEELLECAAERGHAEVFGILRADPRLGLPPDECEELWGLHNEPRH